MIVVYAVSRNIETPQNLFDHPCHMYISSSISTTKTIYIKTVLKKRQSTILGGNSSLPTKLLKYTKKSKLHMQKLKMLKPST